MKFRFAEEKDYLQPAGMKWLDCEHLIYHFDPNDMSAIKNLPADYWEYLSGLEESIHHYMRIYFGSNNEQEL